MARWTKSWEIAPEHWLRSDLRYLGAWNDLIMLAEWKDGRKIIRGSMVETKRGTAYISVSALSERWKWNARTVRKFLARLEDDGMVVLNLQNRVQSIILCNYGKFQGSAQSKVQNSVQSKMQSKNEFLLNKEKEEYKEHKTRARSFANFEQRQTDYDALFEEGAAS